MEGIGGKKKKKKPERNGWEKAWEDSAWKRSKGENSKDKEQKEAGVGRIPLMSSAVLHYSGLFVEFRLQYLGLGPAVYHTPEM